MKYFKFKDALITGCENKFEACFFMLRHHNISIKPEELEEFDSVKYVLDTKNATIYQKPSSYWHLEIEDMLFLKEAGVNISNASFCQYVGSEYDSAMPMTLENKEKCAKDDSLIPVYTFEDVFKNMPQLEQLEPVLMDGDNETDKRMVPFFNKVTDQEAYICGYTPYLRSNLHLIELIGSDPLGLLFELFKRALKYKKDIELIKEKYGNDKR